MHLFSAVKLYVFKAYFYKLGVGGNDLSKSFYQVNGKLGFNQTRLTTEQVPLRPDTSPCFRGPLLGEM